MKKRPYENSRWKQGNPPSKSLLLIKQKRVKVTLLILKFTRKYLSQEN